MTMPPFYRVRTSEQANERRARDSNPQPLAGHLISNQLADFGRSPTNLRSRENCVAFASHLRAACCRGKLSAGDGPQRKEKGREEGPRTY